MGLRCAQTGQIVEIVAFPWGNRQAGYPFFWHNLLMFVNPPELAPDLEWMLQSGQVSSKTLIDTLTREHYEGAYHLAYSVVGDHQKAQQAVRTAFIAAVVNRFRYRAAWGARSWIYRLVWRACRSYRGLDDAAFPPGCYGPRHAGDAEQVEAGLRVFRSLQPIQRVCLYLAAEGIPDQEKGFILGIRSQQVGFQITKTAESISKVISAVAGDHDPGNGLNLLLTSPAIPELLEADYDAWIQSTATEAERHEKRFPLAVLAREFAFFGVLAILLAGGYLGARGLALSPTSVPTPRIVTLIVHITATPGQPATPSPTPTVAHSLAGNLPEGASEPGNPPVVYRIPITDTLVTNISFTQTIDWSKSGSLGLAGILNFWGLGRSPAEILADLQPNPDDQTVMAYELLAYVEDHTSYRALLRFGGDEVMLARLVHAGFPVMIERYDKPAAGSNWIGRYEVVAGYENGLQPSLSLWMPYQPQTEFFDETYKRLRPGWQALNYNYLLVYPSERENQLFSLLSTDADERTNLANATWRASAEIYSVDTDQARFFAWFNYGVNLAYQDDYSGAAQAFDEAHTLYETLADPFPLGRLLLYQTRPYWAYYYTGRYQELIQLASDALVQSQGTTPEEGYYWRALAREALGDLEGAIQDLRQALVLNPHFEAGLYHLKRMTVTG